LDRKNNSLSLKQRDNRLTSLNPPDSLREERLTERESQLSAELDAERVQLITLNRRLDELGQEAAGAGVEKK